MDPRDPVKSSRAHRALLLVALAPVAPQVLGSAFNVWYNTAVIEPLLQGNLKQRFIQTVIVYNVIVFPVGIVVWLNRVYAFSAPFDQLRRGLAIAPDLLAQLRRRLIHLPWFAAVMSVVAWFLCIPVFLASLWQVQSHLPKQVFWHLPISVCISGFISLTHTIFLVELASQRGLFPVFFSGVRPDRVPNVITLSLRGRGILWAVSASLCPIGSLLLLAFAPQTPGTNPQWFAVFVGIVGIAFGLCTAIMISGLVARPIDFLRSAAESVSRGELDVNVPVSRADELDHQGVLNFSLGILSSILK